MADVRIRMIMQRRQLESISDERNESAIFMLFIFALLRPAKLLHVHQTLRNSVMQCPSRLLSHIFTA